MHESEELISVIVPVYNRESVLEKCIESVLHQTYNNIQLILVDDGSTDNSLSVCQSYAVKDSRVLVVHQSNRGPAVARNTGLDESKGKYIMFVDSDDCLHQKCIEIMYNAIKQFNVSIAVCEYGEQNYMFGHYPNVRVILKNLKAVMQNGLNEKENTLYCWAKLWSWELIRNIRFKPLSFCEDVLFSLTAYLNCQTPIAYVMDEPLYYYFRSDDSITKNLSNENLTDSLKVTDYILQATDKLTEDIQKLAINYCISIAFFAYLQAQNGITGDVVRTQALELIKKNRKIALCNFSSSLKVKVACLFSYVSMDMVSVTYRLIKR